MINEIIEALNAIENEFPVMAEVQVSPGEPRGRGRSADADLGADPLFGIQF
jgi:hypothetical protein